MNPSGLLSTSEVAHRLGVRRETVYAYVSRGMLARHAASGHRRSLFDPAAVEQLAARARRADRSGALDVVIETRLTSIDPDGRLFYRGHDVMELARFRTFERVAGLLWDGDPAAPWELEPGPAAVVARLRDALGEDTAAVERVPVVVSGLGAADVRRADRRPDAVRRAGARMLAGALDALPKPEEPADRGAAERLWAALSQDGRAPRPAQRAALDCALVLLADHELAASTLAARVAASAWADPYRVVLAGLGALGGALHGAASVSVESTLVAIRDPQTAFAVLQAQFAAGGAVPGFGHRVYRNRDPRADHLLARIASAAADEGRARVVAAVVDAAAALGLPAPNVDLALAGLCHAMRLRPGAASLIFSFARIAGLLAHGLEEYPHRLRFRPRATYVGTAPRT